MPFIFLSLSSDRETMATSRWGLIGSEEDPRVIAANRDFDAAFQEAKLGFTQAVLPTLAREPHEVYRWAKRALRAFRRLVASDKRVSNIVYSKLMTEALFQAPFAISALHVHQRDYYLERVVERVRSRLTVQMLSRFGEFSDTGVDLFMATCAERSNGGEQAEWYFFVLDFLPQELDRIEASEFGNGHLAEFRRRKCALLVGCQSSLGPWLPSVLVTLCAAYLPVSNSDAHVD